jgi:hypothetical protein
MTALPAEVSKPVNGMTVPVRFANLPERPLLFVHRDAEMARLDETRLGGGKPCATG